MRIDCHCDTIMHSRRKALWENPERHCDFSRLIKTVDIQFMAVFPYLDRLLPDYKEEIPILAQEMIRRIWEGEQIYGEKIKIIKNQKDLLDCQREKKLGILMGIEGGEVLDGCLHNLDVLFSLGVRSFGLTWNYENDLAWGCHSDKNQKEKNLLLAHQGLKPFGKMVIERANQLGMIIDLAHISYRGFWCALDIAEKPVLFSHGNCYGLCPHVRNLRDEQLRSLAERQGVLGISFVPSFLSQDAECSIEDILRHIDYGVNIAGIDGIGIGSDFDGIEQLPQGVSDTTFLSYLEEALDKRGYCSQDIHKIMGENVYRVVKANLPDYLFD